MQDILGFLLFAAVVIGIFAGREYIRAKARAARAERDRASDSSPDPAP